MASLVVFRVNQADVHHSNSGHCGVSYIEARVGALSWGDYFYTWDRVVASRLTIFLVESNKK